MKGNIRGVNVKVSFWFFASVATMVYVGVNMLALLSAAFIHEMGHLFAVWALGGSADDIVIYAFGAKINPKFKTVGSHYRDIVVTISGPLLGALASVFFFLINMHEFAMMNLILTCFNLLPLNGLDGGSLLTALKWLR